MKNNNLFLFLIKIKNNKINNKKIKKFFYVKKIKQKFKTFNIIKRIK